MVFLTKEHLLFVFQSPSHVISQKMTSLEQLICQRDVLQGGKFSFLTGETYFMHECIRGDSGYLQIQQGWPQSPEARPAVLWYLRSWCVNVRSKKWEVGPRTRMKLGGGYVTQAREGELRLECPDASDRNTSRKGRCTVVPWCHCVEGLESVVSSSVG